MAGRSKAELPQFRAAEHEDFNIVLSQGTESICTESQAQSPEADSGDERSREKRWDLIFEEFQE